LSGPRGSKAQSARTRTNPIELQSAGRIAWCPQDGPQTFLVQCPADDIFFGGARGGGKSDGELGEFGIHQEEHGQHSRGVIFRRHLDELEELIDRSHEIYGPLDASFDIQKKRWDFARGGSLRLRSLERLDDARKHQGRAYTRVYFDELTNFEDSAPFDMLWGSVRSVHGVPCKRISTGNPGGPGHVWVKERYIDPGPWKLIARVPQKDRPDLVIRQVFIPSFLEDNQLLQSNDPLYESRLSATGGPKLFRAWRYGDWTALEGQFFDCFSSEWNVAPIEVAPRDSQFTRWISMDWGFEHPASTGFFRSDGERYELARSVTVPHHDAEALARMIVTQCAIHKERGEQYDAFYLSPDAFAHKQDENTIARRIGEALRPYGFPAPRQAVTDRVNGWRAVYDLLRVRKLVISASCPEVIRLFASAIHDPDHPEDMLKFNGDDPLDMLRYGVMTRLLETVKTREEKIKEKVADKVIDVDTGAVTLVMPTDPNVVAMRARLAEHSVTDDAAPFRPRARGW